MKEIGSHKNIVNFLGACTVQGKKNNSLVYIVIPQSFSHQIQLTFTHVFVIQF